MIEIDINETHHFFSVAYMFRGKIGSWHGWVNLGFNATPETLIEALGKAVMKDAGAPENRISQQDVAFLSITQIKVREGFGGA